MRETEKSQKCIILIKYGNMWKLYEKQINRSIMSFNSRRFRWAGHVARMEEGRSAFKTLTGKCTGERALGRPRGR